MRVLFPMLVAAALLAAACSDPTANLARATTGSAAEVTRAEGKTLKFSHEGSAVEFVGSKVTGTHKGGFQAFRGTAIISDDGSKLLQVEVEINVDSIWTDDPSATNEKLTGHLKSGDFFDAANHPKAKFVSTEIKAGGEGGTHTLTGNLTMRGITKGISFPANVTLQGGKLTADAAFKVNRKDFGMKYDGKADNLIRDDVGITLKVSAS